MDLRDKRDATIVRRVDQTLVDIPRPVGEIMVRGRTKKETLARVHKLSKRGYILAASEIGQFHARAGGGYGVKVALARPLPEPMPGWAKGAALVGIVLTGCAGVAALAINAIASLLGAAASLPWAVIVGGAVVFIVAAIVAKRAVFGSSITVTQKVTIR